MGDCSTTDEVLREYYNAMNKQDLLKALSFLGEDVMVIFPESDRNWSGKTIAKEKFEGMFKRMPGFYGEFDINSVTKSNRFNSEVSSEVVEVKASCRFSSSINNEVSKRDMEYTIDIPTGKILKIVHY
mmetsp:Transcript_11568/g.15926  ORF Transcript_11568/g.15926 Transcript_11568/m.15926 type:complete len:128 (-) Transcript_11568:1044-1427(-)